MNYLRIVQLTKSKPASELTLEEVALLHEAVSDQPELYHLLGGREEFERYMAEAPDVTGMSAEEIAAKDLQDRDSPKKGQGSSHLVFWLTTCLLLFVFAVAGAWIYLVSHDVSSRLGARRETSVADEQKDRASSDATRETKSESDVAANPPERIDGGSAPLAPDDASADDSAGKTKSTLFDDTLDNPPTDEAASHQDATAGDNTPAKDGVGTSDDEIDQPLPKTYALFEDDGQFAIVDGVGAGDTLSATLAEDDRHSGRRSIRLVPGNRFRLTLDQSLPIRRDPGEGEYRYLRFAFRKFGGGRVCLELEDARSEELSVRYDAGRGPPSRNGARRVWGFELPSEWIVMTCDLFSDFDARDVTALTLSAPDGAYALFDHVYLDRTIDGLDKIDGAPSAELTNQKARRVLAKDVISMAGPAVVSIEANGHHGTGVLIGNQGHVLTCAHLLFALKRAAMVRLADGRTVRGRTAGICRNADCGVIQLTKEVSGLGIEISDSADYGRQDLHVGFSLTPQINDGQVPASYLVEIDPNVDDIIWADFEMEGAALGGPLVDREGRVIGIHVRTTADGKMGFAKLAEVRAQWKRLTSDQKWGEWPPGTGPMIGVVTTAIDEGSRVDRVMPDSPAAKVAVQVGDVIRKVNGHAVQSYLDIGRVIAGHDPGDTVDFQIRRDEKEYDKRIRLMHRQEFPVP